MMDSKNPLIKKCHVCGKKYEACSYCESVKNGWRYYTCSRIHFQLYMIIADFSFQSITKEEAKEQLKTVLPYLEGDIVYTDEVKPYIEKILK